MAMDGYVWLCTYGYLRLWVDMHGYVWLCMVMYGSDNNNNNETMIMIIIVIMINNEDGKDLFQILILVTSEYRRLSVFFSSVGLICEFFLALVKVL